VLMHDAAGNMEEFKRNLELWFDNSMERVSGWYKRQTQWILLVIAAVVTVWTNADSVGLANTLWRDPAMRSALVAEAEQYDDQQQKDTNAAAAALPATGGPPPPPALATEEEPEVEVATAKFNQAVQGIQGMGIPLGWRDRTDANDRR